MQEVRLTWSERIREEARGEGFIEGKRETVMRQLTAKFGPLSPETTAKVASISSAAELDAYLDRILSAESLEDLGLDH